MSPAISYRALAGAQCVHDARQEQYARLPDGGRNIAPGPVVPPPIHEMQIRSESAPRAKVEPHIGKVGILGAGAAGLYAAMILESFGIECVIHEAGPKPGGRLHTHYFEPDRKKYQYYDVGAMRYPVIPIMERTFDLFRRVGFHTENGALIKYYLTAKDKNTPLLYNHRRFVGSEPPGKDYFYVSVENGGTVPDRYVTEEGTEPWLDKAFEEYKVALAEHWQNGWQKLMHQDLHSTRAYMSQSIVIQPAEPRVEGGMSVEVKGDSQELKAQVVSGLNYPFDVIQWCETMDSATGLYEQAFSESVMDSLDFGWPSASREGGRTTAEESKKEWVCIDGGGSTLIQSMLEKIPKTKIIYNSRVTAIGSDRLDKAVTKDVTVTAVDSASPNTDERAHYTYDQVLSSLPLSVLAQTVNTSQAGLDYQQTNAIRALHYDCSVKVGIRFKQQWWRLEPYNITGGTATTDHPLRTCVYPSYGLNTEPESPGVLMASYTWAQDATRLGALVQGSNYVTKKYPEERELIDLIFRDLAALHGMPDDKVLRELYMDHYAHNWFDYPNATGAFALFGAGQFSKMYPALTRPAAYNRRLHLIGEATSVHHAWVVGALNSAWRGVYNLLRSAGCTDDDSRIKRLKERPCCDVTSEGEPCEPCDDRNWGPIPEEMGRILNQYQAPLQPVTRPVTEPSEGVGDAPRGAPRPPPTDAPPTDTRPPGYFIPAPDEGKNGEEWWEPFTPGRYSLEV